MTTDTCTHVVVKVSYIGFGILIGSCKDCDEHVEEVFPLPVCAQR